MQRDDKKGREPGEKERECKRWERVHIEADNRPFLRMFSRPGRYSPLGSGSRRERGALG